MEQLVVIPKSELAQILRDLFIEFNPKTEQQPQPTIRGIHGLAKALGCSVAKAQGLKNSGAIRYFQNGKLLLFDYQQVIEDLKGVDVHRRGRSKK